ncbi:MAG: peptidase M4 [Acidobacteriota bacterium]|nr:MAG: peptidase M4 [Acidobacteriota bacterium]
MELRARTFRKIHRWLGVVIGIQFLMWTSGGLYFSRNPIEKVHGETEKAPPKPLGVTSPLASPDRGILALLADRPQAEVRSVTLRPHLESAVYEIAYVDRGQPRWVLADAATGGLRGAVGEDEAREIAIRSYLPGSPVRDVSLVTEAAPGSEYRERPLPAYRVSFDDALGTRIYVSAERGLVTARRNDRWRLFDLLWMFHIMDYEHRDDFNTPLLQVVSGLGLATILSGFALFAVTSPRLWRRAPFRKRT